MGQNYRTSAGTRRAQPVVKPASTSPLGLSFWNLVECSVIAVIRRTHRVSLQKVRRALNYVSKELGKPRPLIEENFSTDGVDLFVERYGKLISASQAGQLALRELLEASLTRIERDEADLAAQLFPWSHRPDEPRSRLRRSAGLVRPTGADRNRHPDRVDPRPVPRRRPPRRPRRRLSGPDRQHLGPREVGAWAGRCLTRSCSWTSASGARRWRTRFVLLERRSRC